MSIVDMVFLSKKTQGSQDLRRNLVQFPSFNRVIWDWHLY